MNAKQKRFWTLTKAEKRIAIAKDIIKQIKAKMIIPESGIYIVPRKNRFLEEDKQLDEYFSKTPCGACALGACFIGIVDAGDKLKVSDILTLNDYSTRFTMSDLDMSSKWRDELRRIFSPLQLSMIESAFEKTTMKDDEDRGRSANRLIDDNRRTIRASVAFGMNYRRDKERLLEICKNIIKNGGKFIP